MNSLELLVRAFWSPSESFRDQAAQPRLIAPLAFLLFFSGLVGVTAYVKVDNEAIFKRMLEQDQRLSQLSAQQKEQFLERARNPNTKAFGLVFGTLSPIVMVLLVASFYFVAFTVFGREGGFKAYVAVTALGFVPAAVRSIAATTTLLLVPSDELAMESLGSIALSVFLDRAAVGPVLYTLTSFLDVVFAWTLALLIIGYSFLVRRSVSKLMVAGVVLGGYVVLVSARVLIAGLTGF